MDRDDVSGGPAPVAEPSDEELSEWRVLAHAWLDVAEIVTIGGTGFVGRIVLRLLDAVIGTRGPDAIARAKDLDRMLAMLQATDRAALADVPSLAKDFHTLYRLTEGLVADMDAEGEIDLGVIKAQLQRLAPAFEECEVARRMAQGGKGRESP